MNTMKFGEMSAGQWFREINGNRVFIKLQNRLPSGIEVVYDAFEPVNTTDDRRHVKTGSRINSLHYNAVDQDGIPGSCPDWIEFEVIEAPVEQRYCGKGLPKL